MRARNGDPDDASACGSDDGRGCGDDAGQQQPRDGDGACSSGAFHLGDDDDGDAAPPLHERGDALHEHAFAGACRRSCGRGDACVPASADFADEPRALS